MLYITLRMLSAISLLSRLSTNLGRAPMLFLTASAGPGASRPRACMRLEGGTDAREVGIGDVLDGSGCFILVRLSGISTAGRRTCDLSQYFPPTREFSFLLP
jgi:hypothetical protein